MEETHGESQWVRQALTDGWLFCLFHSIVYADTGQVFGHEALIRARHPHTGEVYGAGPIIDAASKLDMHHILDQKARKTAIREAALLREMRGRIFINFMPNTIYDPEICLRTTMEAAHEYGVPLSRLVFEVVETEQIPDMKKLERILDYYRRHGAGTAVDDMGAGYASVEYLAALQPDFVKIAVIAEGIETPEPLHLCREAGTDFLQGYLFGLPANPPALSLDELGIFPGVACG